MLLLSPLCAATLLFPGAGPLAAQELPTTQPNNIQILRERIKIGMDADHEANESGWPQAMAQDESPTYYLAMASLTGSSEVWFVTPFDSYASWGKDMAWGPVRSDLSATLSRLATADGQYLESLDIIEARAVPELGVGAFPDLSTQRFWDITIWRIRPGHEKDFADATTAYRAIVKRAGVATNWRTYEVTAGMPNGTYLTFSSVSSFGGFDANMTATAAINKAMTPAERTMLAKFLSESVEFTTSNKYRLSPTMSYVPAETKAADPAFWNPR